MLDAANAIGPIGIGLLFGGALGALIMFAAARFWPL